MRPPFSVYLAAFVRRFPKTCSSLVGSASTIIGSRGTETVSSCSRLPDQGGDRLDRPGDDGGEVHDLLAEVDLPLRDPGDVEQVLDQAVEGLDLVADDPEAPGAVLLRVRALAGDGRPC